MTDLQNSQRGPWYGVIKMWRETCLIEDSSLFTPDKSVWTPSTVADFYKRFVEAPDEGAGSFAEKLDDQLKGASPETIQFTAELLFVHLLGVMDIRQDTKLAQVRHILGLMETPAAIPELMAIAQDGGFARTGIAFKTYRYRQLTQLLEITRALKKLPREERTRVLGDPWGFKEALLSAPVPAAQTQRNATLHLLHPETFEGTVSDGQKKQIASAFSKHVPAGEEDIDRQLAAIRKQLEIERGHRIDFYSDDLRSLWEPAPAVTQKAPAQPDSEPDQVTRPTTPSAMNDPNIIYYGPPGTGKTYITARKAVEIVDGQAPTDREAIMRRFAELRDLGQVEFLTFHQSYSYEEFVEGIRPVISDADESGGENKHIAYECRSGVLRNICSMAAGASARSKSAFEFDPKTTNVWKMSLGNTRNSNDAEIYEDAIENGVVTLGYGKGLDFAGCDTVDAVSAKLREKAPEIADNDYNITAVNTFKNSMQLGDLVVVSDGNRKFRAIGRLTGEYRFVPRNRHQQVRPVEWLLVLEDSLPHERILRNVFSQQTIYCLRDHVLKPDALRELLSGNVSASPPPHVLIIDEINRGNIAKILGELITLLEPDKRIGAANEVRVTLPYSGDTFGVPANLYVIGTMNTADRSIALIDTALRRRFRFEEMMPDSNVLRQHVGEGGFVNGVDVAALLDRINERIELLYDRDHMIGHAYFLKVHDLVGLRDAFVYRVIPLLQEYFYGDWTRVALALGCGFEIEAKTPNTKNPAPLLRAKRLELKGLEVDHDIESGVRFSVNPAFLQAPADELDVYFHSVIDPTGLESSEG